MFKMGLLLSTAMTAVALLLSGAPAGAFAETDMHVADRDPNTRFLCTYGQFKVSFASGSSNGSGWRDSTRVAVPVVGRGQTVSQIAVMESLRRKTRAASSFSAGIYSNNRVGRPGNLIAGGTGKAPSTCGLVTIYFAPTTLQPKTKYWIEEKAIGGVFVSPSLDWYVNPKEKRNAFVKTYLRSCSSSGQCHTYKTHWTRQTGPGPWFKLK